MRAWTAAVGALSLGALTLAGCTRTETAQPQPKAAQAQPAPGGPEAGGPAELKTVAATATAAAAPAAAPAKDENGDVDAGLLLGAWRTGPDENFTYEFSKDTVLLESDMEEHPYRVEGKLLHLDPGTPESRIFVVEAVTADALVLTEPDGSIRYTYEHPGNDD